MENLKREIKKRAIFVTGQKGGSGKTTCARGLVDMYRSLGVRVAAWDADGENGQLLQYYGERGEDRTLLDDQDPLKGIGYFDIRDDRARDTLLDGVLGTAAEVIVVDLPGGSVHELAKVFKGNDVTSYEKLFQQYRAEGFEVVIALVISDVIASVRTVSTCVELFGSNVTYVVVKNMKFGEEEEFLAFDGFDDNGVRRFGLGREMVLKHNGEITTMPELNKRTYSFLDLYSLGFTTALDHPSISKAHRARVNGWLSDFATALRGTILDIEAVKLSAKSRAA